MRIHNKKNPVILLFLALSILSFSSCSVVRLESTSVRSVNKSAVANILTQMPAENSETENKLNRDLMALGSESILFVCESLVPPGTGDDTGARYALSSLSRYVFRPGAEGERKMYANVLAEALDIVEGDEVKAFLIRQLQFVGREESVAPLSKFLTHDRLYEPAVQALLSIKTGSAEAELISALPLASDKNRLTIIKALGDLRSKAAAFEIMKFFATDDNDMREIILYALANIGPYTPDALFSDEMQSEEPYRSAKAASNQLLYAKRLTQMGQSEKSAEICRDIIKAHPGSEHVNIRVAALNTLFEAVGENALWDFLAAVDSPDKQYRISAMELANRLPGKNTTIEFFNKMQTVEPGTKLEIQSMLRNRDKSYSIAALEEALPTWVDEEGFLPIFNGKNLSGWKGLVGNPLTRKAMTPKELEEAQAEADKEMMDHWRIEGDILMFDGEGSHIVTIRDYGDFELKVDWKIEPGGDSGIYLRGSPQVQIWDIAEWSEGSGGLYNNQQNPNKPVVAVDKPVGEWNSFHIIMIGEKVTVYLNDVLVVDDVVMENYWDRDVPIFETGQIELQSHGSNLHFRNIRIKELNKTEVLALDNADLEEGFISLFNGEDLTGWVGDKEGYVAEDGKIVVHPEKGGGSGNLFTEREYTDFNFRFEFRLTPGANNGLGIRAPLEGDAAYVGMELQILDNNAEIYKDLQPYQYHGSIYGVVPAKRGYLHSTGSWNSQEVIVEGRHVTVILNDIVIVDADIDEASTPQTIDGRDHPGLNREKGHIGFLGHGSTVEFRNIRIKEIK